MKVAPKLKIQHLSAFFISSLIRLKHIDHIKIQYFPFMNISGITNGGMDLLPKDGPTPWLKLKINTAQSPILGLTTVVFYAQRAAPIPQLLWTYSKKFGAVDNLLLLLMLPNLLMSANGKIFLSFFSWNKFLDPPLHKYFNQA